MNLYRQVVETVQDVQKCTAVVRFCYIGLGMDNRVRINNSFVEINYNDFLLDLWNTDKTFKSSIPLDTLPKDWSNIQPEELSYMEILHGKHFTETFVGAIKLLEEHLKDDN